MANSCRNSESAVADFLRQLGLGQHIDKFKDWTLERFESMSMKDVDDLKIPAYDTDRLLKELRGGAGSGMQIAGKRFHCGYYICIR